jgi:hypothetical protein
MVFNMEKVNCPYCLDTGLIYFGDETISGQEVKVCDCKIRTVGDKIREIARKDLNGELDSSQ